MGVARMVGVDVTRGDPKPESEKVRLLIHDHHKDINLTTAIQLQQLHVVKVCEGSFGWYKIKSGETKGWIACEYIQTI